MKRVAVLLAVFALFAAACGDDDDTSAAPDDGQEDENGSTDDEAASGDGVTVTVTADGTIEMPDEIAGGVVEVTVDNQSGEDELEVDFVRVQPGTSEQDFRTAISAALQGEEIASILEAVSGIATESGSVTETVLLEAGEHFVFAEIFQGEDEEGDEGEGAEPVLAIAPLTVTEGDAGELPETDGSISAVDFGFEIDVAAGEAFTFVNDGPNQFHHAVLFGFGSIEASVVEENFQAFLEAESPEDLPEALADMPEDPFVGGSGVFSPGLGGTFRAPLESGNTYAAVCFLSDRAGSPPHVFAYDMFEVFTVE